MTIAQDRQFPTGTGAHRGLTNDEVAAQRRVHGPNALPTPKPTPVWVLFLGQFKNPLVTVILAAAIISLIVGEYGDFAIIAAVIIVDAVLGFIQEYRAQRTYTALKGLLRPTTSVIRDGTRQEVDVRELVPGDLVVLGSGEHIPADGEVVEATRLAVDEAILTGESDAVVKSPAGTGERSEITHVYMGTTVRTGRGLMRVTETGPSTELGQIATSLHEEIEDETPLQIRLKAFSHTLTRLVLVVTAVIFAVGLISGRPLLEMLRVAIILAIAAVPEGLLIAVTVILVLGMRKILKRNGLVKRMLAVETLGSVTTICTDKTGTLTEGRMRVTRHSASDLERALQVMCYANDLEGPVDAALWEYARDAALESDGLALETMEVQRISEELFSSETKYMSALVRTHEGVAAYLKGAPEIILDMCEMTAGEREAVLRQVQQWAGQGLRLLGLAWRPGDRPLEEHTGYRWLGLVAMEDPIRDGVRDAIDVARNAGIRIKMITGDYRVTAAQIASQIGIPADADRILDGAELATMSDEALAARVEDVTIFARIRPQDKLRIVRALQSKSEITAMIGDGVNDAPALKRANIGVVVGSATDVAKETADLILLDSNFRTVVAAIEEGRVIFENIRKVVGYTLSNSFAEVLLVFGAMLLGWPAPLLVAQILWIHLICDGPSDIVLGFEPRENGIMTEPPRRVGEPILNALGLSLIGIISTASAAVGLLLFGHYLFQHQSAVEGRSFAFASFAVNSMVYIFAYRSLRRSIFKSLPLKANKPLIWAVVSGIAVAIIAFLIPGLRNVLGVVPLTLGQWVAVFGVALGLLVIVEIGKAIANSRHPLVVAPHS